MVLHRDRVLAKGRPIVRLPSLNHPQVCSGECSCEDTKSNFLKRRMLNMVFAGTNNSHGSSLMLFKRNLHSPKERWSRGEFGNPS
jgi:hypothetical protein